MVVVAIIAILAAVVVPTFLQSANKTKGRAEVTAMFSEIAIKEEGYKSESSSNTYLAAPKCPTAGPQKAGYSFQTTCATSGSAWETLRVQATDSTVYCAYQVFTGLKTAPFTPPTGFKNSQGVLNAAESNLASSWWYVVADCDEDSHGGKNAQYFMSSIDTTLQVQNAGS